MTARAGAPAPSDIPTSRVGNWLGVSLERLEHAGSVVLLVTITRRGISRRRWFADESHAVATAIGIADTCGMPFFDLRDEAGE